MTRTVAVAAPHADATAAGEAAARAGGNALDAALAAAAVLAVTYPHQCGVGGDLTALVRRPDGSVVALLSLGAAAAAVDVGRLRAGGPAMPRQGPQAVTVPGATAGWAALADLGAELGLAAPVERAARLAEEGTPVVAGLARAIASRPDAVTLDPGLRGVLAPGGVPLREGDRFRQPALAATLRTIAERPLALYDGPLAERFADGLRALDSPLTIADLRAHRAELTAPLTLERAGVRWWAAPPPSQGAVALAMLDLDQPGDLLERARRAHDARQRLLGDPRSGPIDIERLRRPVPVEELTAAPPRHAGDTVAVTAIDDDGWSVALIQSNFQTFGAGMLEPGTGIVLHNRGSSFLLEAGHPGAIRAGSRPPHTLCPLLAEGPGLRLALGCQGGRAQPLILAQVADGAVDPVADPVATLAAPRWVVGDRDIGFAVETVLAEPGAAVPSSVAGSGLTVAAGNPREDLCGHVQLARIVDGAGVEAAADPRADGTAAVVRG
ncbi:gamma-glutamyltransferase [Patulibacter defluvii]|uniref:gamma-glutamyltransferase n=1 Tax=Patulibacter defluvii TaxID=3095358 RepID=UPI002A75F000|nr:gamma-glutamyltransferase [Patulibacter sp. DM4]